MYLCKCFCQIAGVYGMFQSAIDVQSFPGAFFEQTACERAETVADDPVCSDTENDRF